MKKFLTRKNIGFTLAALMGAFLMLSVAGKLFGSPEALEKDMHIGHLMSWVKIIGIGELVSVVLFVIPRTMKLGTVLLSAYWGGAIMFHMAHPDPAYTAFTSATVFLILTWTITWIRGNDLIDFKSKEA